MVRKKSSVDKPITKKDGSITVEAAFVMPIVALTILALVYLGFYLYDYNRLLCIVDLVIYQSGITIQHEADITTGRVVYEEINHRGVFYLPLDEAKEERKINKLLEQELSKGFFIIREFKTDVEIRERDIQIAAWAEANIDLPLFSNIYNGSFNFELVECFSIHNPTQNIRVSELILSTGSKIKGVDKLKELLNKLIINE